jgi:hypothetical protein
MKIGEISVCRDGKQYVSDSKEIAYRIFGPKSKKGGGKPPHSKKKTHFYSI